MVSGIRLRSTTCMTSPIPFVLSLKVQNLKVRGLILPFQSLCSKSFIENFATANNFLALKHNLMGDGKIF